MSSLTSLSPEVERAIRDRVDALKHGGAYTDHVWLDAGMLIAKRTLLAALGCDVSQDPPVRDPFARANRKALMQRAESATATPEEVAS